MIEMILVLFSRRKPTVLLALCVIVVSGPAGAVNLGDLNIPASRVPDWYAFDETEYTNAKSWTEYDVSCASGPCASGRLPYTAGAGMTSCSTVSPNSFGNISCHIMKAPAESVLYIPSGTYTVGAAMVIGRSDIVIRGAGHRSTILNRKSPGREAVGGGCDGNTGATHAAICSPGWKGAQTSWTGGYTARTTTVSVGNGTLFRVGGWIRLRMSGSTSCVHMDKPLNAGSQADGFVHIAKVVSVNGGAVTMDRGLRMDYNAAGCSDHQAHVFNPLQNVGIEAMRFTSDASVPVCNDGKNCIRYAPINIQGAVDSWIVDNRIDRSWEMWTKVTQSARIWFQGNDFENLDESIVFNTEGMYVKEGGVDTVWENNTCKGTRVCQKLDNGAEGTVTAYNYMRQSQSKCERAYFNHGHYTRESLFEGNDVDCEVLLADKFWGRNGPRITAYRNRNVSSVCASNRDMISINEDGSADWFSATDVNIIGNTSAQFGTSPVQSNPPCPPSLNLPISSLVDRAWLEKNAWRLAGGSFAAGNTNDRSCGTGANDSCPGTNYNVTAPHTSWNGTYPTSLYRTSTPSWWCEEACPWSTQGIGAFGDDWSSGLCKLPAQIRAEGGACTLPDGSQTQSLAAPTLLP